MQPSFYLFKIAIETLQKGVKYVKVNNKNDVTVKTNNAYLTLFVDQRDSESFSGEKFCDHHLPETLNSKIMYSYQFPRQDT